MHGQSFFPRLLADNDIAPFLHREGGLLQDPCPVSPSFQRAYRDFFTFLFRFGRKAYVRMVDYFVPSAVETVPILDNSGYSLLPTRS